MENVASQVSSGKHQLSRSWECGHVYLKCNYTNTNAWETCHKFQGSSAAHNQALENVYSQLEAERNASSTAMDEAMKKISTLQKEKAQLEMEVMQFKRETHQKIESAQDQLDYYHNLILQKDEEIMSIHGFFSSSDAEGSCSSSDGSNASMGRKNQKISSLRKPSNRWFNKKTGRLSNLSCDKKCVQCDKYELAEPSVAESCTAMEKNLVGTPIEPLLKDICSRIQGLEEDIKLIKNAAGADGMEVFVQEKEADGSEKEKEESHLIAVMMGVSVGYMILSVLVGYLKPRTGFSRKM